MHPGQIFLTAEWRDLVMLNYELDPSLLSRHIPFGTELDSWNGKTFVSLVGFRFLHTRVFGIRFPFHCNFDEVNLRFYVRRTAQGETRRGVVFIQEIVPRRAIALVARAIYNEPYSACRMTHNIIKSKHSATSATYSWKSRSSWNSISLSATGELALPASGTLAEFITEHYWGYSRAENGRSVEYHVTHPQWRILDAADAHFEGDATALYGNEWTAVLKQEPSSAFLAEGSEVVVYRGVSL